jgi:transcriptional regulator with XRE-family HTH domain
LAGDKLILNKCEQKYAEFARRLKHLCKEKGINNTKLAKILSTSRNTVSAYMSGGQLPSGPNLLKMSTELGTSIDYLLTGEEQRVLAVGDASCLELPLHDPRPLQVVERRYLEKAVYVLRSPGIHGRPDEALASAIEETYDIVQASKR